MLVVLLVAVCGYFQTFNIFAALVTAYSATTNADENLHFLLVASFVTTGQCHLTAICMVATTALLNVALLLLVDCFLLTCLQMWHYSIAGA